MTLAGGQTRFPLNRTLKISVSYRLIDALTKSIAKMPISSLSAHLQQLEGAVQTLSHRYEAGSQLELHTHDQTQLLFATQGLMEVTTPVGRWLVPPQRAVWLPASVPHSILMLTEVEMRTLYIETTWIQTHSQAPNLQNEFVVSVGPLLRGLVLTLFNRVAHPQRVELAAKLVLYELSEASDSTTFIPMPSDARARKIADLAIRDPQGLRSFEDLAYEAGVSQRTAARLFSAQTQLTFKKWRQRARIMAAINALSRDGVRIKQIGLQLGFSSTASFTASFHEVMGVTPGQFLDQLEGPKNLLEHATSNEGSHA
ncbi:AraC family transcriptional regulator [Pseudomonas sp. NPDC085632]|jgi:AraC-like DNA-binding protein/quercetin dioxygenase-like cupin family protein|uniref:AraC family transcriptional regulator n=1 Tax=Pseudomonas sp. NPDC085632 TaxID=3364429 RepID=UPI0037C76D1C